MERTVRLSNREVMNSMMEPLTEAQLESVSVEVAKSRATYLIAALKVGADDSAPSAFELKELREDFEEKRDAFSAVMTAIERGYLDDPER
jgi:hypothetical protein|tara:strand:+ start:1530 stop:1799 length:270 start_codon:yes stop_codon:yes gene_type:complete